MLVNDNYVAGFPSAEAAVSLFAGTWSSKLPLEGVESGYAPLFSDGRVEWFLSQLGSIQGMNVLELGPLEAAHTYMLHKAGAGQITGIEANSLSFLKCLLVKEIFGLDRAKFLLGDFTSFFSRSGQTFDLIVASGVLYHLTDPLVVLSGMVKAAPRIFIWSHFFDDDAMPVGDPRRAALTGEVVQRTIDGQTLNYHMRSYGGKVTARDFCGGIYSESVWLELKQVRALLEGHGYVVTTALEEPAAANGPAACLLATRA
ncbi:class I SAM-dependent methyltransferase [Methylocystis sp. S23]